MDMTIRTVISEHQLHVSTVTAIFSPLPSIRYGFGPRE